jgi:hypothetical protein
VVAHQSDPADVPVEPGATEKVLQLLGIIGNRPARGQMPQCQHRVRFSAAEAGLQVDHRGGVLITRDPGHRAGDQILQAAGQEGAAEKLDRVGVLRVPFTTCDHRQVGGELRRPEVALGDVVMGTQHLPPRQQPRQAHLGGPSGLDDPPVLLLGGDPPQIDARPFDLIGGVSCANGP